MADTLPRLSWKRRVGSQTNRGPEPVPGPLLLSNGWEARLETIYQEDSQKVSQDGASEDFTDDSRMGPRSQVWIEALKDLARVRPSFMPVNPKPRNSRLTPEWSPLRRSGNLKAACWVIGCGKSSSNYHSGISQSKTHGVASVRFCEGQADKRTGDGRKLFF